MTRSTLYEGYEGPRLPRALQIQRVNRVIAEELTPCQREILLAYYIDNRKITDIFVKEVCASEVGFYSRHKLKDGKRL